MRKFDRELFLSRRRFMLASVGTMFVGAVSAACGNDDEQDATDTTPRPTNTISGGGDRTPRATEAEKEPTEAAESPTQETPTSGDLVELEISAENIEFNKDTLTAPAGARVRLTFTNDDAVPHNVAVYESEDAEEEIFVGEIFSGPTETMVYEFDAPDERGTYFFRCDVHPQMTGDFIAT